MHKPPVEIAEQMSARPRGTEAEFGRGPPAAWHGPDWLISLPHTATSPTRGGGRPQTNLPPNCSSGRRTQDLARGSVYGKETVFVQNTQSIQIVSRPPATRCCLSVALVGYRHYRGKPVVENLAPRCYNNDARSLDMRAPATLLERWGSQGFPTAGRLIIRGW